MISCVTGTPVLETERLTLRAPGPEDLPAYRAFYDVSDMREGGYRGGRSRKEIVEIHASDIAHWHDKGFGMFLLRMKGLDTVLGGAGIKHPNDWTSHELTWWLMPEARGKGIASEASREIIRWACDVLGWLSVETHMRDGNLPARRLAERLGGRIDRRVTFPDGVVRDVFVLPRASA